MNAYKIIFKSRDKASSGELVLYANDHKSDYESVIPEESFVRVAKLDQLEIEQILRDRNNYGEGY